MTEAINLPVDYRKITQPERRLVRETYAKLQNGNCFHCGCDLSKNAPEKILSKPINKKLFPESFFNWPVHLHHDHKTGLTIGAVHNYCNAVLWQYYGE